MRQCGPDYVLLFKRFPLLPLRTPDEAEEARQFVGWLDSRTELTQSAKDYVAVLNMLLVEYDVNLLDEPLPAPAEEAVAAMVAKTGTKRKK